MSAASFARSSCAVSVSPRVVSCASSLTRHAHVPSLPFSRRFLCPRHAASVKRIAALDEANVVADKPSTSSSMATTAASPSPQVPQDTVPSTPATFTDWELDFGSRPVLDERGKKWWELLIVGTKKRGEGDGGGGNSPDGDNDDGEPWVYSRWLPNTKINSAQLKAAISDLASQPGAQLPTSVRFFRGAMQNIITRALTESGIKPVPSRRCFALYDELERRSADVYPLMPGFSSSAPPPFGALGGELGGGAPAQLPDALRGEAWAFVQLPLEELAPELDAVRRGDVFGAAFDVGGGRKMKNLPLAGTPIPGVAVYSRRALPLAAWTAGYEVASLTADAERRCLVLDTGVAQRWRYGAVAPGAAAADEASAWEAAKAAAGGLHFLVIQEDDEADVAGLWLLLDRPPPNV